VKGDFLLYIIIEIYELKQSHVNELKSLKSTVEQLEKEKSAFKERSNVEISKLKNGKFIIILIEVPYYRA
jgi:hypothetical protein